MRQAPCEHRRTRGAARAIRDVCVQHCLRAPALTMPTRHPLVRRSTMQKAFTLNVEDSNCAKIGSPEDKEARKGAAETEPAWQGSGQEPGMKIWRIEAFEVKAWPEAEYGNFYEGDSYIVLQTTKDPESDKLNQDVFFWLGLDSSQDEQGTAAYKTVELDDLLDGAAVQHREVMMHESQEFNALFKQINYLKGGVASGFNHVEEGACGTMLKCLPWQCRSSLAWQLGLTLQGPGCATLSERAAQSLRTQLGGRCMAVSLGRRHRVCGSQHHPGTSPSCCRSRRWASRPTSSRWCASARVSTTGMPSSSTRVPRSTCGRVTRARRSRRRWPTWCFPPPHPTTPAPSPSSSPSPYPHLNPHTSAEPSPTTVS